MFLVLYCIVVKLETLVAKFIVDIATLLSYEFAKSVSVVPYHPYTDMYEYNSQQCTLLKKLYSVRIKHLKTMIRET